MVACVRSHVVQVARQHTRAHFGATDAGFSPRARSTPQRLRNTPRQSCGPLANAADRGAAARARVMLDHTTAMASNRFVSICTAVAAAALLIATAAAGVQQGAAPPDALGAFESGLARYAALR